MALKFISIGSFHAKLWGPKVARVPTLGISRLPFGNPETKCHLDVGLVERHIIYYKGEGGGFPQVRAMVSLVSPCLPTLVEICDFATNKFATSCNYLTFTTTVGYIYNYCLHLKPLATTLRLTYD